MLVEFLKNPSGWLENKIEPVLYLDSATGKWERKVRTGSFFVQSDYGCAEGGNLL